MWFFGFIITGMVGLLVLGLVMKKRMASSEQTKQTGGSADRRDQDDDRFEHDLEDAVEDDFEDESAQEESSGSDADHSEDSGSGDDASGGGETH
ncbi:hypothetical protein [Magnetococcus sp. PR-3]|uniref:hypothetical protein n=1 Tax=Magnetococcus sp. PR-3 TaxID=3120355 RepID=UPI002FCE2632